MARENKEIINVSRPFLPPIEEYSRYLAGIWDDRYLTNQGPLLTELELRLKEFLDCGDVHIVTNGTIALQLALKAQDIDGGEIITTPFSFIASAASIVWEKYEPVFVDIEPFSFCIDSKKIEEAITSSTRAILAVHIFGQPCDIEEIEDIADRNNLKVIYDGAHAFGVKYKNKSLLSYGNISTCSFHATKLFHTVEGGCVITRDKDVSEKLDKIKQFGRQGNDYPLLGINAKASEFQAAMGLCNLGYLEQILAARRKIVELYDEMLEVKIFRPKKEKDLDNNYGFYPVVFSQKTEADRAIGALNDENIYPKRYFYPSLNTLAFLNNYQKCPISEDISTRIICLPLYEDLDSNIIKKICQILNNVVN